MTASYQIALKRIHAEYLEMPGMRLTPMQVERLCGIDREICTQVLNDLVRKKFLYVGSDGMYGRIAGAATRPRPAMVKSLPARHRRTG